MQQCYDNARLTGKYDRPVMECSSDEMDVGNPAMAVMELSTAAMAVMELSTAVMGVNGTEHSSNEMEWLWIPRQLNGVGPP